ncbi:MAG: polyphenol oxidase family protein [Akkermansiaceae bacterium]
MAAGFVTRVPGIEVDTNREATVARLEPIHRQVVTTLGFDWENLQRAEQIHGDGIAIVQSGETGTVSAGVDGLMTADVGVCLGIYVADCGAVYLSDPVKGAIALLHSGKKGTEANIIGKAIAMMQQHYGSDSRDIQAALAPCIRPPAYEVDFASEIRKQATAAGILEHHFTDSGTCTSSDLETYYSYRLEKGNTGRMLALLGRNKK